MVAALAETLTRGARPLGDMDSGRRATVIMLAGIGSAVALFVLMGEFGYTGVLRWAVLALGVVVPSGIIGYLEDQESPAVD